MDIFPRTMTSSEKTQDLKANPFPSPATTSSFENCYGGNDAESEVANNDVQSTIPISGNIQDPNKEFWLSHFPGKDSCSELKKIFIDIAKYGRPRRDLQGVRNRFSPAVSDDISTTILIFEQLVMIGETRWQPVSWAPDDDEVAVQGNWDNINQQREKKGPSSLDGQSTDPNDFALGRV